MIDYHYDKIADPRMLPSYTDREKFKIAARPSMQDTLRHAHLIGDSISVDPQADGVSQSGHGQLSFHSPVTANCRYQSRQGLQVMIAHG
jgi:hypothetical protein